MTEIINDDVRTAILSGEFSKALSLVFQNQRARYEPALQRYFAQNGMPYSVDSQGRFDSLVGTANAMKHALGAADLLGAIRVEFGTDLRAAAVAALALGDLGELRTIFLVRTRPKKISRTCSTSMPAL